MVIDTKRYTLQDLWDIDQRPENKDKRFELINGEILEVPTPNPTHNYIVSNVMFFLQSHVRANQLGFVFGDASSYTLSNGDELIPDVSFVSKDRLSFPLPEKLFLAPDLAVEVFSPSNREREMLEKAESYLTSGAHLVWIIYPIQRVVDICRLADDGSLNLRKVDINGTLDGEDVLPGLKLIVRDIFPPEESP